MEIVVKFCSFKDLAALCNQEIEVEYQKICSILSQHGLKANDVLDILIDYSKGEDLAEDTVNNLSKRLVFLCSMESNKTLHQEQEDGWITFGTIHSEKQRYDLKRIEGSWYARVNFSRGEQEVNLMGLELNQQAQEALNQRLA